jgi:4-amino-4-deoxy-L-arabinose transferase-like glycosyltransferase
LLGRKLFGVTAGLVACASYAVMSVSSAVVGLAAHATHFVVLFAVPATLLLLKACETNRRSTLFFSGLLYGLAFLMKQQGVFFGVFGWAFLACQAAQSRPVIRSDFAKKTFTFGLGMILPFGLTCLFLALAGVFSEFWFWTFTYARSYVTSMPWPEGIQILRAYLSNTFDLSIGFWMMMAVGLPLALFSKSTRNRAVFLIILGFCSFLGTATGLYFRPHYFILMLPAFALMQGMAVVSLQQAVRFRVMENVLKSLPIIFFATVLAWTIYYQALYFFQMSPVRICQNLYIWNPFVESLAVAGYIREHSAKDARIAVMGSEPQIYFYAQRHSATGYIYTYALMESQPNALKMQHEMMREIEAAKPEYMVYVSYELSWSFKTNSDRTIIHWFDGYADRFYRQVGVVDLDSNGKVESFWDEALKNHPKSGGWDIAVYKRKSDFEIPSVKTN